MRAILVEETAEYKAYKFEYTVEEWEAFKKEYEALFKGTKYAMCKEYTVSPE